MYPDPTKKDAPRKEDLNLKAGLYLIATPIGNLRDISLRALDVLAACDVAVCEDTRHSGKLLKVYSIEKPFLVYNDHASDKQRQKICQEIASGKVVALMSDAGMPLISDPGYKLVRDCMAQGLYVTTVPGANAPLSALQLSGLPSDSFNFAGFIPSKDKARHDFLFRFKSVPSSLIFFETAGRLLDSLKVMESVFGDRSAAVVRELTKFYEEGRSGVLSELVNYYEQNGAPKGEIVIVVAPPIEEDISEPEIDRALQASLKYLNTKQASSLVAEMFDKPKKELYARALQLSKTD